MWCCFSSLGCEPSPTVTDSSPPQRHNHITTGIIIIIIIIIMWKTGFAEHKLHDLRPPQARAKSNKLTLQNTHNQHQFKSFQGMKSATATQKTIHSCQTQSWCFLGDQICSKSFVLKTSQAFDLLAAGAATPRSASEARIIIQVPIRSMNEKTWSCCCCGTSRCKTSTPIL
jgi:hypothetical protein